MFPEGLGDKLHQARGEIEEKSNRTRRALHRGFGKPTSSEVVGEFLDRGLNTVIMVADSVMAPMDQEWMDLAKEGAVNRWVMPSERSIPAVAVGRYLATGESSVMAMQNTGFSHAMEYIRTIMRPFGVPGLVFMSWRGHNETETSLPHVIIGEATDADTRNVFNKEDIFGRRNGRGYLGDMRKAIDRLFEDSGHMVCLRLSPDASTPDYPLRETDESEIEYFDPEYYEYVSSIKGRPFKEVQAAPKMTREEAFQFVFNKEGPDVFIVDGNGYGPRCMQALQLTEGSFDNDGGFGSSLAIAWGAAKSNPDQKFVAIDGDQNAFNSEMDKILSSDYPLNNLSWYIFNNGTGESVGPSRSRPLTKAHYELAYVINTKNEPPVPYRYKRIGAFGAKFRTQEALTLASEIGDHPAQMALARQWLTHRQALREDQRREDEWSARNILTAGIPQKPATV